MTFARMVQENTAFLHAIKDLRWLFPPLCQRKDQALLTETERSRYVCAFNMINNDGTLSVDSTKLSNALTSQNSDVQNFFQAVGTGYAQKFTAAAESMTDPTQGALSLEMNGISASVKSLQKSIDNFESRMTSMQQNLLAQYSKIDAMLQQMPLIISQINSQLGSL